MKSEFEKFRIYSEQGLVSTVLSVYGKLDAESVEDLLGIEFAYSDGTFRRDLEESFPGETNPAWESLPLDTSRYRLSYAHQPRLGLPHSYPVTLILGEEGPEYVYPRRR